MDGQIRELWKTSLSFYKETELTKHQLHSCKDGLTHSETTQFPSKTERIWKYYIWLWSSNIILKNSKNSKNADWGRGPREQRKAGGVIDIECHLHEEIMKQNYFTTLLKY